tara:strand:- start:62 stop:358 length:297 start_codon:yes stop_codon:yes gene_type:complete
MSRRLPRPYFPIPPEEYQRNYFSEVIRAFSVFLEQIQNPGDVRATDITITNLPTDDSGLENGGLFSHNGIVRVPLTHSAFLRGSQGTGTVGSVTVSTT